MSWPVRPRRLTQLTRADYVTEHLRMQGIYWGLTALALMGRIDALPREEMLDWVMSCWDAEAGTFGVHDGRSAADCGLADS